MENKTESENQILNSPQTKEEIFKERVFNFQNRNSVEKKENNQYLTEIDNLKKEIAALKSENFNVKTLAALEKSGCLKPELVIKAVPQDCENLQDWIDTFKTENEILFKQPPKNHGGNFKPSNCCNLSPTELMNNYIRGL